MRDTDTMTPHTNQVVPVEPTVRHAFEDIRNDYIGWQDNPNFKVLEKALFAAAPQQQGEPVAVLSDLTLGKYAEICQDLTKGYAPDTPLYTQPLTADASFNQGIEESVNRAAAFVANNECEIDLAGLAGEIRNGKRPTDMVTMTRDEYRALIEAASAIIQQWDSTKGEEPPYTAEFIDRLRALVSRALEGK